RLWLLFGERGGAQPMADDLGAAEQLVAPAMVAVVMSVDHAAGRGRPHPGVQIDQLAGVRQVPEGGDDPPSCTIDEAGVAGSQPAIFLQAGVDIRRETLELHDRAYTTTAPQRAWR